MKMPSFVKKVAKVPSFRPDKLETCPEKKAELNDALSDFDTSIQQSTLSSESITIKKLGELPRSIIQKSAVEGGVS